MRLVKLTSWDDEDVFFVDGHWIVVDNEDHARSLILAHNGLEIAVQGTPAEVAALLAGEGESETIERPYLMELANLLVGPLTKDDFFTGPDLVAEVKSRAAKEQSLTAEVERLRGERDEALCSWESEAADNASLRSEVERLKALNAALNAQVVEDTDHDVMALWEQAQDDVARVRKSMDRVATAAGIDTSSSYLASDVVEKIAALKRERDEARAALAAMVDGNKAPAWPAPEPEEPAPTELAELPKPTVEMVDAAVDRLNEKPAPATPTGPTVTTIDARSRISIEVHGECVVQPELGPRAERTVFVRADARVTATAPNGLELCWSNGPDFPDWSSLGHQRMVVTGDMGSLSRYLWTSDPAIDVRKNKDLKYPPDACVLHVKVVPDDQPLAAPFPAFTSAPADPAFFDPAKILATVRDDPEAARQIGLIGRYGNDTIHWRRHQERFAGTGFAGLRYDPNEADIRKRFTDGNCGWDALGDAVLLLLAQSVHIHWDEDRENLAQILRSKLIDNPLCQVPFGLVGKNWDEPSPFRHWWGRAAYRSFVDVLDLPLAYKLLQDSGLVSAVLSPQDEAHVRENFRRFVAFVEADMAVSDPRMWRTANVLAVECLRHLFPSLGLPDLSGYLTRWDGDVTSTANSVLTPEDPPRWLDKGDYTAHHMMGVCYSVWAWIAEWRDPSAFPYHHIPRAIRIWTGIDGTWMWAKKTGTPQDGQDHRCARFTNSLTQIWFPRYLSDPNTGKTTEQVLGSQDHALFVVAGCRVAS